MIHIFLIIVLHQAWAKCPSDTICETSFHKCYKFVVSPTDFFDAEEQCIAQGGHLVSVQNAFENAIIGESAISMFEKGSDYWIGANYILNNNWSWTDDTQWSYTNWMRDEPKSNEVVSVELASNSWMSSAASSQKPFVCELLIGKGSSTETSKPQTCPTRVPTTCPTIPPYCEDGWTRFSKTNSCYKKMLHEPLWGAENVCTHHGAHLVSIHSQEENTFVAELTSVMPATTSFTNNIVIGIYQEDGQWYWTDNSTVNFLNWGRPESPSRFGTCGFMYPDGFPGDPNWNQKWDAAGCDSVRNFVCKKPALV